jgi:hypothetical protein
VNLLLSNYWTMGAVRHGDYVAKIRIAPVSEFASRAARHTLDLASAPEVFRPALLAELRERRFEFDIQVQLCADIDRMPVEDVTVEWPEQLSPFVTVAKVRIPQQDISGDDNLEKMDALSFTPWRVTAEDSPSAISCGPGKRSTATRPSSATRSTISNARSPAAADEVLP